MTDEQLIDAICQRVDTISPGGVREIIRMVRDHDREERRASIRAGARRGEQ